MNKYITILDSGSVSASDGLISVSVKDTSIMPVEVIEVIQGVMSVMSEGGILALHMETSGHRSFTHVIRQGGNVDASEGVDEALFNAILEALPEISEAIYAPPPVPEPSIEEMLAEERSRMTLSFAQLIIGLVAESWITEADGEGWLQGILPASVLATINLIPADQRFAAKAKASRPSVVERTDPLVGMMAMAQGKTDAEIDAFFRTYRNV